MLKPDAQMKNGLVYFVRLAVGALFPLIMLPVFTRVLTKADYGVLALVQVYAVLVTGLCNLGMFTAFDRNYFEIKGEACRKGLLLSTVLLVSLMLTAGGVLTFVFSRVLSFWFVQSANWNHLLFYAYTAASLTSIAQYFYVYLRNEENAAMHLKLSVLEKSAIMIASLALVVWQRMGVEGLALGQCAGVGVTCVVMMIVIFRDQDVTMSRRALHSTVRLGLPLTPRILIGTVSNQFDKYMIGLMKSSCGVGVYSIGQMLGNAVFVFATTLQNVFQPQVYRRMFEGDDKADEGIGAYLTPFVYLTVSVAMMLVLFAEEVLSVYLPSSYHGSIEICIVLALYYALLFFGKQPQLIFRKRTGLVLLLSVFRVILNVVLNLYFILKWGALGAAIATFIAGLISTFVSFIVAQASYRIHWEYGRIVAMYVILFIAAIGVLAMRRWGCPYMYKGCFKIIILLAYVVVGMRCGVISRKSYSLIKAALSRDG